MHEILGYYPEFLSENKIEILPNPDYKAYFEIKVRETKLIILESQYFMTEGMNSKIPDLIHKISLLCGFKDFNGISVWQPDNHFLFKRDFKECIYMFLLATAKHKVPKYIKYMLIQLMDYQFR